MAVRSETLLGALRSGLPQWYVATVRSRAPQSAPPTSEQADRFARQTMSDLEELLACDIDQQRQGPLDVIRRRAVPALNAELEARQVPRPSRDVHAARIHPEDHFDVAPATWADFGPEVGEAGLAWGAAKAFVHLRRRAGNQP